MAQRPIIIAGLGEKEKSPIAELVAPLDGVLYSWKEIEEGQCSVNFEGDIDLVDILGHSLGGYAAILLAASNIISWPQVRLTLIDPVTGDTKHPWAQIGAPPLKLPPNVIEAHDYLRMGDLLDPFSWPCFPPYHQPLLHVDGVKFRNVQIADSNHNSIVAKVRDEVIQRIKGG